MRFERVSDGSCGTALRGLVLTSDSVLSRVNGMSRKPTPVLAVLPTIRSPAVVSLTFLPPDPDAPADPLATK